MIEKILLPAISEDIDSGDVLNVLVNVGEIVGSEQSIIELETDKTTFEVPSPIGGKVVEIAVAAGDNIKVGQVILKLDTDLGTD